VYIDVDPGTRPGGTMRLEVTYYNTVPSRPWKVSRWSAAGRMRRFRVRSDASDPPSAGSGAPHARAPGSAALAGTAL